MESLSRQPVRDNLAAVIDDFQKLSPGPAGVVSGIGADAIGEALGQLQAALAQLDYLFTLIRTPGTEMVEVRRFVGPSPEQLEASKERLATLEQLWEKYGALVLDHWPPRALDEYRHISKEQTRFESDYR